MLGDGEYFVFRAKGDAMKNDGISDGDLLVIKKQAYAKESQIVAAIVDGEVILKRYHEANDDQWEELDIGDKRYKAVYLSGLFIIGVAVKIIKGIDGVEIDRKHLQSRKTGR